MQNMSHMSAGSGGFGRMNEEENARLQLEIESVDKAISKAKEKRDLQRILEFHEKSLFLRREYYAVGAPQVVSFREI